MKNQLIYRSLILLFCFILGAGSVFAQKKTTKDKEEAKKWKKTAKAYVKQPLNLKQDMESYQSQINGLKNQLLQLQAEYATTSDASNGLTGIIDSLKWETIQLQAEKQQVQKKLDKMEIALKGEKKVAQMGTKLGLVFRTQIGAFITHEMQNPPKSGEDFVHEKADGFNKYLVGNFRTQPEAEAFAEELKKLGIKDAWAVPYIDGVRVTFAEANTYLQKQSSGGALQPVPAPAPAPQDAPKEN
ncbi:MAG: SPOR domain-containing protein [Bacteroidia bacterium]|nr:SPOR domain-containing protein [Bacteroidia bacterium]